MILANVANDRLVLALYRSIYSPNYIIDKYFYLYEITTTC